MTETTYSFYLIKASSEALTITLFTVCINLSFLGVSSSLLEKKRRLGQVDMSHQFKNYQCLLAMSHVHHHYSFLAIKFIADYIQKCRYSDEICVT